MRTFIQTNIQTELGLHHAGPANLLLPYSFCNSCCRYSDLQWASTGLALHGVFQLAPRSPGGRVVALGASFVATIVICMYIASYSAQITVQNLPKVADISQLYGKPVGIWEVIMKWHFVVDDGAHLR